MKNITKFFLTISAFGFLAVACQPEPEVHEPGEPDLEGCYGVYFPEQENTGTHTYDPTMATVAEIIVNRADSKGDITVPVTVVDPENAYSLSPIHFADGQAETILEIDFSKVPVAAECPLSVIIEDPLYASKYNKGAISFDYAAFRVEWKYFLNPETNEPATVTYTEGWNGHEGTCKIKYYEVDGVRTCETVTDPFEDVDGSVYYGFWADSDKPETGNEFHFIWYTNGKCYGPDGESVYECIQVPEQDVQYHDSYDQMVKYYDYYAYWTILNPQDALVGMDYVTYCSKYSGNYQSSYYDGNGGFYFFCKYYYMIGLGGWGVDEFDPICITDGFTRVDYTLEAETDYSYEGSVPVYFTSGVDVAEIDYVVAEGELSSTKIAAAVDSIIVNAKSMDIQKITEFEYYEDENVNESAVEFTLPETGLYTVVAVALDTLYKAQNSTSIVINYVAAEDEGDYYVQVSVGAEAVPARYEVDPYTTMAYFIQGHDLTEVHFAVIPSSQLSNAFVNNLKYDSKYAVSAEILEAINGKGGYYTYVTNLAANTEYAAVVWATNGYLDGVYYVVYKTPMLPYVWKSLGIGQYTDNTLTGLYMETPEPITVDVEVFQEEANPNLIMFRDHALPLTAAFFEVSVDVMKRYENGNWRHTDIILDVTNPNSVIWAEQDYGVCANSSDGFIDGLTNMYNGAPFSEGFYKDGVIAFPTPKGMLCTLNGDGYYYANQTGDTKLVLPAAAKTAIPAAPVTCSAPTKNFSLTSNIAFQNIKLNIERDIHSVAVEANAIAPKAADKKVNRNSAPVQVEKAQIAF